MPTPTSTSIARTAALYGAAAVLIAGCGGSSGGAKSATKAASSRVSADCQAAQVAQAEYQQALKEFQLNFKEHLKLATVLATSSSLRARVSTLAKEEQAPARQQLERFAGALARQEQVLQGIASNRTAGLAALAKGLNTEIPEGLKNLPQICAKA